MTRADLIITAEGRFDEQSLAGKAVGSVLRLRQTHAPRTPLVVIAARGRDARSLLEPFEGVRFVTAVPESIPDEAGFEHAGRYVRNAAARALRALIRDG